MPNFHCEEISKMMIPALAPRQSKWENNSYKLSMAILITTCYSRNATAIWTITHAISSGKAFIELTQATRIETGTKKEKKKNHKKTKQKQKNKQTSKQKTKQNKTTTTTKNETKKKRGNWQKSILCSILIYTTVLPLSRCLSSRLRGTWRIVLLRCLCI